jgi:hypothetical protein
MRRLALLLLLLTASRSAAAPNILFIVADDLGWPTWAGTAAR